MVKEVFISIALLICFNNSYGQQEERNRNEIGVYYFGELGLHPGIEIDRNINFFGRSRTKMKRSQLHQLNLRPSIAYYLLPKYSNNFLITPGFNYHFKMVNNKSKKYFFVEPYFKCGYLRYSYIGKVYKTTNTGFTSRKLAGGNSLIYGGGLNIGGSIKPSMLDWVIGSEYLAESTEGRLLINHVNFKLGVRVKYIK